MDAPLWFRPRGYMHFDVPVGIEYAKSLDPVTVGGHAWSPLIHYVKEDKRYKPLQKKTIKKARPIMFASHRDACVLSCYSSKLVKLLDEWYEKVGLSESVVAYRSLGKANYHFAKRVEDYVKSHSSLTVMCFDVTGFFDNLNHGLLKSRLKWILGVQELPADWYSVFKAVSKYRAVKLEDLKSVPSIKQRLDERKRLPLASIPELKALGISIQKNNSGIGIPQGTPISASFSNLYLSQFDLELLAEVTARGGLYQRYSDDILIACPPAHGDDLETLVTDRLLANGLQLQTSKTERKTFSGQGLLSFQYLGYQLGQGEARIRPGSLSRQWRAARRAVRKVERAGKIAIAVGSADRIFTRKLHKKFNDVGTKNFVNYAKRSGHVLESKAIKKQLKRLRKFVSAEMERLKK